MRRRWLACCAAPASRRTRAASAATARPASSTISMSIMPTRTRGWTEEHEMTIDRRDLRPSATFPAHVLAEIHRAADQGLYEIRGFGAKRKLPTFDDLVFLGASVSRYPLEGYREKCATDVWLGTRFAKKPIHLKIP